MLYPPFKNLHSSVPPSVRSSALCFHSLLGAFFNQFSSNLVYELILGRSVLRLQMGKFQQISTELWPLIDIINWFLPSIFGISLPIFFKHCMRVDIGKECFLGRSVLDCRWVNFDK